MNIRRLELSQHRTLAASPEQVWNVFRDLERWPQWNVVCDRAQALEGGPWTPGFRFRMDLRMAGVPVTFTPTVIESDPPNSVTWSSTRLGITGTRTFTFEIQDGITVVTDRKVFESTIVPVAIVYPRNVIRAMSERWLRCLGEEVENRATIGGHDPSLLEKAHS